MRYVIVFVGTVVALIAMIAVIGWSLPVKHRASVSRTYRAAPSALYQLITDVSAFPHWRGDVLSVETLPDENGHKRWTETTKNGPPITYRLERMVPDRLLVGRIANTDLAFGGGWTYELIPVADCLTTLRITEDGEVYNPIFRFVSRFIMGHEATLKQYHAAVAKRFALAAEPSAAVVVAPAR